MADDAFIHEVEFAVGAGPRDAACVEHRVADLEQRHVRAHGGHGASGIPAQHARRIFHLVLGRADLGVHRVHGNRLHLDQQVVARGGRLVDLHVHQRLGVADRQVTGQSNGFHCRHPFQQFEGMPAS
ncbi:hypothetical protein D3C81_1735120 [compost metagenome]